MSEARAAESASRLYRPTIFASFSEVVALHSLRDPNAPGQYSMLRGADEDLLAANRVDLLGRVDIAPEHLLFPHLEHKSTVVVFDDPGEAGSRPTGDAVITRMHGWLIGVTVADCVAVLLYDPEHYAVGVIHSGWRGSAANVAAAAVAAMHQHYQTDPSQLRAYLSPAPHEDEYEVGIEDVARLFDDRYHQPKNGGKAWFDNQAVVYDQLLATGLKPDHIERDGRSTISDPQLHSYRRDGAAAGRSLVAIGLK